MFSFYPKENFEKFQDLHPLIRSVLHLGADCMAGCYLSAALAQKLAPFSPDFLAALQLSDSLVEAAPACLAAAVAAAVICDLALRQK